MNANDARALSRKSKPTRAAELRAYVDSKIYGAATSSEGLREVVDPLSGYPSAYMSQDADQMWAELIEDGFCVDHHHHKGSSHARFSLGYVTRVSW